MFRVDVVGDGGLSKMGGGREEGRKGREGFVQDRCGWQQESEQNGGKPHRCWITTQSLHSLCSLVFVESMFVIYVFCGRSDDCDARIDGCCNLTESQYAHRPLPYSVCRQAAERFDEMFFYATFGAWSSAHTV